MVKHGSVALESERPTFTTLGQCCQAVNGLLRKEDGKRVIKKIRRGGLNLGREEGDRRGGQS